MKHSFWLILPLGCCSLGSTGILTAASAAENSPSKLSLALSHDRVGGILLEGGIPGKPYQLEFTADFRTWSRSASQTLGPGGSALFPVAASTQSRFFQAIQVQVASDLTASPAATLGKRLFLETRFAQFFAANAGDQLNLPLANGGDRVLDQLQTLTGPIPGPFMGQSMNCRVCHLGDEFVEAGMGSRALADFASRSAIPDRGDGIQTTVRNSPALIHALVDRSPPLFLHFDGEFPDAESLVKGTITGRNYGWLPDERVDAIRHVARVIREDDGRAFLGPEFGGAYATLLAAEDPAIPASFRLPAALRMEVNRASDQEILDRVAQLVEIYLETLTFSRSEEGLYNGSPYDLFLQKNSLPPRPEAGESDLGYSRRLRELVAQLATPVFVSPADGAFANFNQAYRFGTEELQGLKIFLAEPPINPTTGQTSVGNCLSCHPAPHFTDFGFHNSGATQWEYDAIHGEGAFIDLVIPNADERSADPGQFLPPSASRPRAEGKFLAIPSKSRPGYVDLGLWNVYGNGEFPAVQGGLQELLQARFGFHDPSDLLPLTVAHFKTPGLRGLGGSAPYMHTGQASTLEAVIFFYRFTAELSRAEQLRNGDPEIGRVFLSRFDGAPLAAFLRSLNEDVSH